MLKRIELPRVELRGHRVDLENLAAVLVDGDHRVTADDGLHWLCSNAFQEFLGDPAKARAKAAELLPLMNGAAKARIPGFRPVELGQCVDWFAPDGHVKRRLTETFTCVARSGERIAGRLDGAAIAEEIEKWTAFATGDEKLADVLRLWGSAGRHDWITLYKLKEKIEAAVGSPVVHGWATKPELGRFDHTANSPAVLGDAARHGVQSNDPPSRPMTINEAHELIERLIRGWLESK